MSTPAFLPVTHTLRAHNSSAALGQCRPHSPQYNRWELGRKGYPGGRTAPEKTSSPGWLCPVQKNLFPVKCHLQSKQFLSILVPPHQKSPAFNKALKRERKGLDMSKATIITAFMGQAQRKVAV